MGGKKHALEIFRATSKGFEGATRDPSNHRKVAGKVLASRRRDTSKKTRRNRPALGRSRGSPVGSTSRASGRTSRGSVKIPATPGRKLLWASLSIVATMSVWVMIADSGGGDPIPLMAAQPVIVADHEYTILLKSYPGTEAGRKNASDAQAWLEERGFGETHLLAFPDAKDSARFEKYELLLGRSTDRAVLENLLTGPGGGDRFPGAKLVEGGLYWEAIDKDSAEGVKQ